VLTLVFAFLVMYFRNMVHSVIALIMVFFNVAGMYYILGMEYLSLILIIVYVGAIAVLFLFVVMMLNITLTVSYLQIPQISIFIFMILFILIVGVNYEELDTIFKVFDWSLLLNKVVDMELIGLILYMHYYFYVILAGLVLLVAMIGSIALTLVHSQIVKRQDVYEQNVRTVIEAIDTKNKRIAV